MDAPIPTKPRFFCFVLMPFDAAFDDLYQLVIREACNCAGAYCERVDEQIFSERILDRIYNQIAKADLVIADMTGRNANVFYEVGYAHALGKPTVLLTRQADDIPFDLKHFPHIIYESRLSMLKEALTTRVRWHVEHPDVDHATSRTPVDVFLADRLLSGPPTVSEQVVDPPPQLKFTFHNNCGTTISKGSVQLGFVVSEFLNCLGGCDETVQLPDGRYLLLAPSLGDFFPDQWKQVNILFNTDMAFRERLNAGHKEPIALRVFTSRGVQEYSLLLSSTAQSSDQSGSQTSRTASPAVPSTDGISKRKGERAPKSRR